ncbi:MAG: VanZ family protein [Prevotella sp.]|nr:VanZ family protein [Prevotella sp.]
MRYLIHLAIHYPLSSFLIVVIWFLCFCTPPHTRLNHVAFIDKWTHIAMYLLTCCTIWEEYLHRHRSVAWCKAVLLAWAAPVVMSGLIEVLQATCTGGRRSGEWLDFAANTTGATLALVIGILRARSRAK